MCKIYFLCFTILFFLLSSYSKAQTENKTIDIALHSTANRSIFVNTGRTDCVKLPFGYPSISKRLTIDSILSIIQDENKLREINGLKFEKVIEKDLVSFPKEYDVFLPFRKDVNEKYDRIKISSDFLCYGAYSLYFIAVYNTVRYADPFVEKMYLISTKDSKLIDMKRIYLRHEGEMGFANHTLFNIDKNYIISLQDYEFTDGPFSLKALHKYQVLPLGKFSRYYDQDGFYKDEEEEGMVKNHSKEGKWIEYKSNGYIDLQRYPRFTDPYTYLEAEYKNGLSVGKWKFYKLLQEYNEETGKPVLNSRKKGPLIYTEIYKEGSLEKREFQR